MKNIFFYTILSLLLSTTAYSQTLNKGDIVIVGIAADTGTSTQGCQCRYSAGSALYTYVTAAVGLGIGTALYQYGTSLAGVRFTALYDYSTLAGRTCTGLLAAMVIAYVAKRCTAALPGRVCTTTN